MGFVRRAIEMTITEPDGPGFTDLPLGHVQTSLFCWLCG